MSKKYGVFTSPLQAITSRVHSHRSSEAIMWAAQLDAVAVDEIEIDYGHGIAKLDGYNRFDSVWIHPGNDWGGGLNLYGGLAAQCPAGLLALSKVESDVHIYVVPGPMPNYSELVRARLDKTDPEKVHPSWNEIDLDNLADIERKATCLKYPLVDAFTNHVIGDSHAISLYRPGWNVNSVPYQTLHGALNRGLHTFLPEPRSKHVENLDVYFGNIDVRHHLCRQSHVKEAARDLARRYVNGVCDVFDLHSALKKVTIYEPLPIENPSRKIPKTGYYKGHPYFGTWAERNEVRQWLTEFIDLAISDNERITLNRWTDYLCNEVGELDFEHMERPQSVHLSRASWPYWKGPQSSDAKLLDFL